MQSDAKTRALMSVLIIGYFIATGVLFVFAWFAFLENNGIVIYDEYNWYVTALYLVLTAFLDRIYSAFRVSYLKPRCLIFSQQVASFVAVFLVYALVSAVWAVLLSPMPFIVLLLAQTLVNVLWSYAADALWFHFHAPLRAYILYRNKDDLVWLSEIYRFTRKFHVVKELAVAPDSVTQVLAETPDAQALFVVGVSEEIRNRLMMHCLEHSVEGFFQPGIQDIIQAGAKQIHSFGTPLMGVGVPTPDPLYMIVKRILAFFFALVLLILVSPILIGAALAIRVFDPTGPVIFTQQRMGRNLKPFTCYKFRTMSVKAPHDCHPRDFDAKAFLSPLGSFLRESSIDELPQIFNILKGDMCFIGPRPVPLTEKELIAHRATIGVYRLYPGISGLAQVSGRNAVNDAEKLLFDYEYLEKFSPLLDIKIFFKTVLFVLMRNGVYVKKTGKKA